jgi:hypothetical protein
VEWCSEGRDLRPGADGGEDVGLVASDTVGADTLPPTDAGVASGCNLPCAKPPCDLVYTRPTLSSQPVAFAMDDRWIYWTLDEMVPAPGANAGSEAKGKIVRVAKRGGPITTVVDGLFRPGWLALDRGVLYFTTGEPALRRVNDDGSGLAMLATAATIEAPSLDGDGVYFFADQNVVTVSRSGGPIRIIAPRAPTLGGPALAVGEGQVFFTTSENTGRGALLAVPKAGGTPAAIVMTENSTGQIAVRDGRLYWNEGAWVSRGWLRSARTDGGDVRLHYQGFSVGRFWLEADRIYWVGYPFEAMRIMITRLDGNETTEIALGENPGSGQHWIAADDCFVYWSERRSRSSTASIHLLPR